MVLKRNVIERATVPTDLETILVQVICRNVSKVDRENCTGYYR